uniref:J domain-containing protein n=1 Tax=Macrostomum lignano TaxID=282301 RepID=A0A1I8HTK8_9PLAT
RLSRIVHPDKRIASSSAGDASSSASTDAGDAAYQRIRRAYDVLRDSETRRIYDEFGLEGLRALTDGAVVLRGRGVAELREELVQLRRLREEAAVMKLTQPATQLTVGLNCSSVFSPIEEDQPKGIYLERLSFSQNTSFILTPKHRLVLAGSLGNMGRTYVPTVSLTMRSQLTDKLSSDVTLGLNYLPTAAGKLTYRLSPNLLASVRAEVTSMQGALWCRSSRHRFRISPKCVGTLSYAWNSPNKGARAEVLWQAAEGFHGKAALFLAPNDAGG